MKRRSNIQLLIPMSGSGSRFKAAGYTMPKPLVPINGTPMIERVLSCFPSDWPATFVMSQDHLATELPGILDESHFSEKRRFVIPAHRKGPGHAVLQVIDQLDADAPVFVSYCDYGMVWDPVQFERFVSDTECDACLISYRGFHAHYLSPQKYAYSRIEGGVVREVREKNSFTDDREAEFASSGGYYFKSARILRQALEFQIQHSLELNGEYYISLTMEALLRSISGARVMVFEIPGFFQWGTPEDTKSFSYWDRTFSRRLRWLGREMAVDQVLMPMAGAGSRFSDITPVHKPLIPVNGQPMFLEALNSLPSASNNVFVTLDESRGAVELRAPQESKIVSVAVTPQGQALSTRMGIDALNEDQDVIISSVDHAIVLNPEVWHKFREASASVDAAIFCVKGFPGVLRKPSAFAYVDAEDDGEGFGHVKRVSVKRQLSDQPDKDWLLVGTFWFRNKAVLSSAIDELIKRDIRVNQELYLDSVFEIMLALGMKVKLIPLDGYICWGDPESMSESLYWQDQMGGMHVERRSRFPGIKG